MQSVIQDKPVKAHVFEHTTACVLTPDKMQFKFVDNKGVVPMQMIFCLKEQNAKYVGIMGSSRECGAEGIALVERSTVIDGSSTPLHGHST
jgi:hypothetical protein